MGNGRCNRSGAACHRAGFTLVEILAIITVIAILAGMMFPVLSRARDAASTSACASNLRQLGQAILLYREDFDDRFPYAIDFEDRYQIDVWTSWDNYIPNASEHVRALAARKASDGSIYGGQIDRVLQPWAPAEEIWRCPGDTGAGGISAATSTSYTKTIDRLPVWRITRGDGAWGGTSYVYRTELGLWLKPASRLRSPASINVLMDAAFYWHTRLHRAPRLNASEWNDYNQGSYNVLFADGHVRNITQKEYYDAWWEGYRDAGGTTVWTPFE